MSGFDTMSRISITGIDRTSKTPNSAHKDKRIKTCQENNFPKSHARGYEIPLKYTPE